ncbi:MAG: hypothetical protein DRO63_07370, partial [Candidatus Gerdarchaeota archaeon]
GNSARSQMAEAFVKHLAQGLLEARSGGTKPAPKVSRNAIAVMKELGLDISDQFPKQLDFEYARNADLVVIMGCGAERMCPAWLVSKSENWALDDPREQDLPLYRKIRDEIKRRVEELIARVEKNDF